MTAPVVDSVLDLVGQTPLITPATHPDRRRRDDATPKPSTSTPGGSVKDRICLAMIEQRRA